MWSIKIISHLCPSYYVLWKKFKKRKLKRNYKKFCVQIIANNYELYYYCYYSKSQLPEHKPISSQSRPQLHSLQIKVPRSFASPRKNEDFSQTWRDTTSRYTLWVRSRTRTRNEKKRTCRRQRTVAAEEVEEEKEEVAGRRRNSVVNHQQYGITGKSAINQGSPGTELGNCLLKNRNDVNPGVPASEPQPTSCRSTRVYIGNPENKTDSAKERFLGGIMRNKINVTQSRLSFAISLPVFAADKCSIYTTDLPVYGSSSFF